MKHPTTNPSEDSELSEDTLESLGPQRGWSFDNDTSVKFGHILEQMDEFMDTEYRQDPEFRLAVLMDQIGDVARHTSHDPERNPPTRPLEEDPEIAFGDALWQLLCVGWSQGIDVDEALDVALDRMDSKEGYHQQSDVDLKGHIAHKPSDTETLEGQVEGAVKVFREFDPESHTWDGADVILTEIGGVTCHGAIVARENDIPCIVGVKGLTDHLSPGDHVEIDFETGEIRVTD